MKNITSKDNPLYKSSQKLKNKKYRDREGLYTVEGFHLAEEALASGETVRFALLRLEKDKDLSPQLMALGRRMEKAGAQVATLNSELFDQLADSETPQGILAVIEKRVQPGGWFDEGRRPGCSNVLVLDRVQDPGNLGTLLRTADAAGYMGVMLLKGSGDVYGPKAARAAAGSLFRMPILTVDGPEEALRLLREKGKRTLCTSPHCDVYYYDNDMAENLALIVGNEGEGVCGAFMEGADELIKIPMVGAVESLNVAIAAAVLMFESLRQKQTGEGK